MLFENNNYDFDILKLAGFDFNDTKKYFEYPSKIESPKIGFLKGNMFPNEYVPYKNMSYKILKPTCEREILLYKIMELDFALNDLNLYLDLHPTDNYMYELFKKYNAECLKYKEEYSKKYTPLVISDTKTSYEWYKDLPWEDMGGTMYV